MEIKGTELEFINDFYKRIGEFKTIDGTLGYIFDTSYSATNYTNTGHK